jgi:hypothetical protein
MHNNLIDDVKKLLDGRSCEERRAVVAAILDGMRKPLDYGFSELDERFKVAREQQTSAASEDDRRRLGRCAFDLDFERRRRQPNRWLGGPPPPREFPEGFGPDANYPRNLGGTLF